MTLKEVVEKLDYSYKEASRVKSLRKFLFNEGFSGLSGLFKLMTLVYVSAIFGFFAVVFFVQNPIVNLIALFVYLALSLCASWLIRHHFEPAAVIGDGSSRGSKISNPGSHFENFKSNLSSQINNFSDNIEILINAISFEVENRKQFQISLYLDVVVIVAIPLFLGILQDRVNAQPWYIFPILYLFFFGALIFDICRHFLKSRESRYEAILKYLERVKIEKETAGLTSGPT